MIHFMVRQGVKGQGDPGSRKQLPPWSIGQTAGKERTVTEQHILTGSIVLELLLRGITDYVGLEIAFKLTMS